MKKYLLILFLILSHLVLRAQVIEQLSPQERKQRTKVTEPITLYKGLLRTGLSVQFAVQDKFFDQERKKTFYENSISMQALVNILSIQYGLSDRLEIEAYLPYVDTKISSSYTNEIPYSGEIITERFTNKASGLGDLVAALRYQIIQDKTNSPAITLGLGFFFPTGKSEITDYKSTRDYSGAIAKGEWAIYPEFRIRKVSYPFSFEIGGLAIKYFGANKILLPGTEPVKVISGTEIVIRPQMDFQLNEWVSFSHFLEYFVAIKDDFEGEDVLGTYNNEYDQWVVRYYPGLVFQLKQLRLEQAVLIPLTGKVYTADPTFYFKAMVTF